MSHRLAVEWFVNSGNLSAMVDGYSPYGYFDILCSGGWPWKGNTFSRLTGLQLYKVFIFYGCMFSNDCFLFCVG